MCLQEAQRIASKALLEGIHAPQFLTLAYTPEAVVAAAFAQGVGLWVVFPVVPGGGVEPEAVRRVVP